MTMRALCGLLVCLSLVPSFGFAQNSAKVGGNSVGRRILAVGDSITWGPNYAGGYRGILEAKAKTSGYKLNFVGGMIENYGGITSMRHEGHGGWNTTDILVGRQGQPTQGKLADWLKSYRPDTVLLMAGTNDNIWVTREEWTAKFQALLDVIYTYNRGMKVVLAAIPKSNNVTTGKAWAEAEVFDITRTIVQNRKTLGYRIAFADTYTSFVPTTDLSDDYHPNKNGYIKIAGAFFAALTTGF